METRAAAEMLTHLHDQFGDWGLTLATYNQGTRAVHEAIASERTRDAMEPSSRGALNSYAPMVMAGVLFLEDPSLLGE
ncbi:MAG: hypothetical protein ACI9MC_000408 [Kiritimatiellia bacterium]